VTTAPFIYCHISFDQNPEKLAQKKWANPSQWQSLPSIFSKFIRYKRKNTQVNLE